MNRNKTLCLAKNKYVMSNKVLARRKGNFCIKGEMVKPRTSRSDSRKMVVPRVLEKADLKQMFRGNKFSTKMTSK